MGHGVKIRLDDVLRSLYAIHSVPYILLDEPTQEILGSLILEELSGVQVVPLFCSQFPMLGSASCFSPLAGPTRIVWENAQLSTITTYIVRSVRVKLEMPGDRLIVVSTPTEAREATEEPRPVPMRSNTSVYSVRKGECMYRTNWNKNKPLGVSNPLYSVDATFPVDFASQVLGTSADLTIDSPLVDMLFALKQNCLSFEYEKSLGICCPLPKDFDALKCIEDTEIFRRLVTVPSLTVLPDRVTYFVSRIMERVLPTSIWGNGVSWRKSIQEYLTLPSRFDALNTADMRTGLNKYLRKDIRESSKRRSIESRIVYFIFKRILIPVVSYLFYVTESDDGTCVYFRRPVWDLLVSKSSDRLVNMLSLQRMPSVSKTEGSTVRWIPKMAGGLRPVVRQTKYIKERTKRLLRYLKALACKHSDKLGYSVFSRDVLHVRLNEFLRNQPPSSPLLMIAGDIKNCFESVPFDGLQAALMDFFPKQPVSFSSVMITTSSNTKLKKPVVFIKDDWANLAAQLGKGPLSIEAAGPVTPERLTSHEVLNEVMKIVKSGSYWLNTLGSTTSKELFRVTNRGLPQGSSFSVMLVAIYYGYLDRQLLAGLSRCCIVRLVDDILCLSRDARDIEHVYTVLVQEQRYGPVNENKVKRDTLLGDTSVSWAGLTLKPDSRGKFNVSLKEDPQIRQTQSNRLSDFFRSILARSIAQNSLPIFFDLKINSKDCAHSNAYRAGRTAGKRVGAHLCASTEEDICQFMKKLDKFIRKRFEKHESGHILVKQFKLGFQRSL